MLSAYLGLNNNGLAMAPSWVVVHCGINDIETPGTWTNYYFNQILALCRATNAIMIVDEVLPHNGNAGVALWNAQLANWVSTNGGGSKLALVHDALADPAHPTNLLAAYTFDNQHLTLLGTDTMASIIANQIVHRGTYTALSASEWDVLIAMNLTTNGDTINIPAGSAHWTTNLTITKGISLIGAGSNSVTGTIIYDDIPDGSDSLGSLASVINIPTMLGLSYRVSGINFPTTSTRSADLATALVDVNGLSRLVRLDHLFFDTPQHRQRLITVYDAFGVADHIYFSSIVRCIDFQGGNSMVLGVTDRTDGTGSWCAPDFWGTTNYFYVEDSTFLGTGSAEAFTDAFNGARYVVRHCTLHNGHLDSHENTRPVRQVEIYNNDMTADDDNGLMYYSRGGSSIIFSNTTHGFYGSSAILVNYRTGEAIPPWGQAYGTNVWDNHSPSAFYSGSHTGTNGGTGFLIDSNASWTAHQWIGYEVLATGASKTNSSGPQGDLISDNTTNTLTLFINIPHPNTLLSWTNGDTFSIYYHTNTMDMCGVGQCSVVMTNDTTPEPVMYQQNAINPVYSWSNSPDTAAISAHVNIRSGTHYFDHTPKPGYTPLIYPHPLVTAQSGSGVFSPLFSGSGSIILR